VDDDWTDKAVLITGGAGGIGRATADRFLKDGATVFLADVDARSLAAAVEELSDGGRPVHSIPADVTQVADCERAVATTVERAGRLDVLVNGAGVWVEGPTAQMSEEQWDRTIGVNLKGTFFCCRYAVPELERTEGCIVNISSDADVSGTAGAAIYNASKGGVNLLTKSLARELAPRNVRVNAVCPTDVDTPMLAAQARDYGGGDPRGYLNRLLAAYPQGERARFVRPEEVAELIVFLASPKVAPITGACVLIDFGCTAGY